MKFFPLVLGALALQVPEAASVMAPQQVTLDELHARGFPKEHVLPEDPASEVGRDWVGEWRMALAEERCGDWTVGDAIAALRPLSGDPAAFEKKLVEVISTCPDSAERWRGALSELVLDAGLRSKKWNPGRNLHNDGILQGPVWEIDGIEREPWSSLRGSDKLFQAAVLLSCDLESIKEVENDYPTYPSQIGTTYESIYPVADTYLQAKESEELLASTLQIHFRCDLPFPFDDYKVDLDIYNRLNDSGELVTDIWANSKDFYWMAGRDVFLPIRDSKGEFVALLLVRQFGFDMKGIPDGDENRIEGLRCSLGNLKRRAERAFEAYGGPLRTLEGALPDFEVRR